MLLNIVLFSSESTVLSDCYSIIKRLPEVKTITSVLNKRNMENKKHTSTKINGVEIFLTEEVVNLEDYDRIYFSQHHHTNDNRSKIHFKEATFIEWTPVFWFSLAIQSAEGVYLGHDPENLYTDGLEHTLGKYEEIDTDLPGLGITKLVLEHKPKYIYLEQIAVPYPSSFFSMDGKDKVIISIHHHNQHSCSVVGINTDNYINIMKQDHGKPKMYRAIEMTQENHDYLIDVCRLADMQINIIDRTI